MHELYKACRSLAPIRPGEAVLTQAYRLPNRFVVHTLGPVYGSDAPESELLAQCFRNSLQIADRREVASIAFPAISTGAFGYPMRQAAEVSIRSVLEYAPQLQNIRLIRFVLFDVQDRDIFQAALDALRRAG